MGSVDGYIRCMGAVPVTLGEELTALRLRFAED